MCGNRAAPGDVTGLTRDVTQVAAGLEHTCALLNDGGARCWGNNTSGQLGDGSLVSKQLPTLVTGGLTFIQISAGMNHTCGVTNGGAAKDRLIDIPY